MIVSTILLIAMTLLAFTLCIFALRRAIKAAFVSKRSGVFLVALGAILIAYLFYNLRWIEPADWAQLLLVVGLVTATSIYALSAVGQADASVKMAEEMKEQRLSEAQPYILLRLARGLVQRDETEPGKQPPTEFQVIIRNVGKGPAINLQAALRHPHKPFLVGDSKGYLAPGEEWQTTRSNLDMGIEEEEGWLQKLVEIVKKDVPGIIAVKYQDIHKRAWVSYIYYLELDTRIMEGEQNITELKNND